MKQNPRTPMQGIQGLHTVLLFSLRRLTCRACLPEPDIRQGNLIA